MLTAFALVTTGCEAVQGKLKDKEAEDATTAAAAPEVLIPVEAKRAVQRSISDYFETTSRVLAERRVEVVSKGTGECVEVLVQEGDKVTEGQVLARLDRKELDAQARQTRVTLRMNEYQMSKAKEQQEKGILSSFEADNARFAYEQARATLDLQELQLTHQDIVAPIAGVITQKVVQKGMVVGTGIPVFSIVDPDSFLLPITPPEKEVQSLREGQLAEVSVDSAPDKVFNVTVRRIDPAVDPATGTIRVILDFDAADRAMLKDSAFARVKLILETRENVLTVQKDTLVEENSRKYLMVLKKQDATAEAAADAVPRYVAERVEVTTGLEDSNFIEILQGIDAESLIVTLGQHTLKAGAVVTITNAEEAIMANIALPAEDAIAASKNEIFDPKGGDRREKMLR
jgi:membrane fusion protein (multidrug efflux system)